MLKNKLLSFVLVMLLVSTVLPGFHVSAKTAGDITQTGIDFLTQPPTQEVIFTAGRGKVTYTPAKEGANALIIFENASINGSVKDVTDLNGQKISAALVAGGNVDLILIGVNTITVKDSATHGLALYNSNVTISGSGSLTVDVTGASTSGLSPIYISKKSVDNGKLTLKSGSLTVKLQTGDFADGILAANGVAVSGGSLLVEGGNCSVTCARGDFSITGGTVTCKDFGLYGFSVADGNVNISGTQTAVSIISQASVGISSERAKNNPETGNVYISGGTVDIASVIFGIYADYGGNVTISGGDVTIKSEDYGNIGGAIGIMSSGGAVAITGGTVYTSGTCAAGMEGYGIYVEEGPIAISDGSVTAKGTLQAMSSAPNITEYRNPRITAATDIDGKQPANYISDNIDNYRYLQIEPVLEQYSICYENGRISIEATHPAQADVLFVAYDASGALVDVEIKSVLLLEGTNKVDPNNFSFDTSQTVKIMLWNDTDSMKPLCAPFPLST